LRGVGKERQIGGQTQWARKNAKKVLKKKRGCMRKIRFREMGRERNNITQQGKEIRPNAGEKVHGNEKLFKKPPGKLTSPSRPINIQKQAARRNVSGSWGGGKTNCRAKRKEFGEEGSTAVRKSTRRKSKSWNCRTKNKKNHTKKEVYNSSTEREGYKKYQKRAGNRAEKERNEGMRKRDQFAKKSSARCWIPKRIVQAA